MNLLLDTCVWGRAQKELTDAGHNVVWSGDWPSDPGDEEILARAFKDFGELAVVRGSPHCGIVRLVSISARRQAEFCLRVLQSLGEELIRGAIVTVEPGRIRVRSPEAE